MDKSKISELKRTAKFIVARASKPGGALEDGTFTMAIARRSISREIGLGETGLDGGGWKTVVKEAVTAALVSALGKRCLWCLAGVWPKNPSSQEQKTTVEPKPTSE